MTEVERLQAWMQEHGHTMASLAEAIGYEYNSFYYALVVRQRVNDKIKWAFLERFGPRIALEIFGPETTPDKDKANAR